MAAVYHTSTWNSSSRSSFRSRKDWSLKWWIMFALILSVIFHGLLYMGFDKISSVLVSSPPRAHTPPPRERIKIDPSVLQEQKAIQEIPELLTPGNQPDIKSFEPNLDNFDKASMLAENQEIDLTPNVKEITNFVRESNMGDGKTPGVEMSEMAALLAPQALSMPDLATEMASVRKEILSKPVSEKQMLLDAGALEPRDAGKVEMGLLDQVKRQGAGNDPGAGKVKGFTNLDELLGHGGQLGGSTAPILMPADLLFEYGSDELAEGARLSLMKLGFLVQKNPNSMFIVEGHTDSYGSESFNLDLSLRRAEAVVAWLRASLRLGTDRIQAVGMGKAKPLVSTSGTVAQQALNRRVEIKVRPRR